LRKWAKAEPCWCVAVCSRTLLTRSSPSWESDSDSQRVCIQMNILNIYRELIMELKKSCTNKMQLTLFILKKVFLYRWVCDFQDLKVSQSKVRTLNGWVGNKTTFWWHIYPAIFVPKSTGTGLQLSKLSLLVGWYIFWDIVQSRKQNVTREL